MVLVHGSAFKIFTTKNIVVCPKCLSQIFRTSLDDCLHQANNCPSGKKQVQDGEYAILELDLDSKSKSEANGQSEGQSKGHSQKSYYYRKKGNWIHEADVGEESFIDTKDMFCNMVPECSIKKTQLGDTCEDTDDVAKRMREIARKKITNEFDRRYDMSSE